MFARAHAPQSPRVAAAPETRPGAAFAPYGNAAMADQIGSPEGAFDASLGGSGSALPFLDEMEGAFGEDLGGVDAHVGASGLPDNLGASAAASGDTVAFASSNPAREQVAHEVAHVLQARRGGGQGASKPGDRSETQAHGAAKAVASGKTPGPLSGTGAAVHGDWIDDASGWVDETVDSVCGGEEEAVSSEAPPAEAAAEEQVDQPAPTEQSEEACPEEGGFMDWVDELMAEDEVAADQAPAAEEEEGEGFMDWLSENFGEGKGEVDFNKKKPPVEGEEPKKDDPENPNEIGFDYNDGALEATAARTVLKQEFDGPKFGDTFQSQIAPGIVGEVGASASVGLSLTGKIGTKQGMDTTPPAPTNDGYWLQTASVFGEAALKASAKGGISVGVGPGVANVASVTGNLEGAITAEASSVVTLSGQMQRYVNLDEGRADPWTGQVSAQLDIPIELSAGLTGSLKYNVLMLDGTLYEMVLGKYSLATGQVTGILSAGVPDGVVSTVGVNSLEWNKTEAFPASLTATSYGGGGGSGAPAEGYGEESDMDGAGGGAGA